MSLLQCNVRISLSSLSHTLLPLSPRSSLPSSLSPLPSPSSLLPLPSPLSLPLLPLSPPPLSSPSLSPSLSSPCLPLPRAKLREEFAQLGAEAENYGNETLSIGKFQVHTQPYHCMHTNCRKRAETTEKGEQKNYVCLFCCAVSPVSLLFHLHYIITHLIKHNHARICQEFIVHSAYLLLLAAQ